MRRSFGCRAIAALLIGVSVPAAAATRIYYHSGSWHVFSGTDAQNRLVCGMGTENPTDGRSLTLTFAIGGTALLFEASKPTWNIPGGTTVPVVMQLGTNTPWNTHADGSGTGVTWSLDAADIHRFDPQFRHAGVMTLSFPSGNEPPWTVSLNGSNAADNTFTRCIDDLSRRAPTPPPAGAAPPGTATQPFGAPPAEPAAPGAPTAPAAPGART